MSALARAVWPGAMVLCCGVCAVVSFVEMGFWVCGSASCLSRARYYLQVRRAKRGSHHMMRFCLFLARQSGRGVRSALDVNPGIRRCHTQPTRRREGCVASLARRKIGEYCACKGYQGCFVFFLHDTSLSFHEFEKGEIRLNIVLPVIVARNE